MTKTIQIEKNNGLTTVTLNRPETLNSFNVEMHTELQNALAEIAEDKVTRCLLLTGAGRGFCAGQDLNDRSVSSGDSVPDLGMSVEKFYNPLIKRLTGLRFPVVCAVNGVAAGAGASIAMACDIVLAARSASFILSFSKVGLVPDSGGSWHFPRALGLPRAMGMALLAGKVKAEQAEQWGLIWQVIDDAQLMEEANKLAAHLAKQPTEALATIKELMRTSYDHTLHEQLERERAAMQRLGRSDNYKEGVAAFLEKREPNFK